MGELLGQRLGRAMRGLDALADAVQPRVRDALAAPAIRNALDGVWLGAPLHPAVTDVPIGATTTAAILDVAESITGSADLAVAADRALAVGVLGALPAAITGAADWRDLRGGTRRVATSHALLNVAGLLLNVTSLAMRSRQRRGLGKAVSALGFALSTTAAHVGGELSFGFGVRVNRTAWQRGPSDFVAVLDESDVADGLRRVEVDGVPVVVTRSTRGEICAIAATCSHFGGPLDEGTREGDTVVCPWHGSRFDLCNGDAIDGPAVFPQPRYDARIRDGKLEIRRADGV
jgi:nitrite reductase/ring-hydroxylating ferredoxin subunit/uncharacterized membrane protein